jgi:hypothetical protein
MPTISKQRVLDEFYAMEEALLSDDPQKIEIVLAMVKTGIRTLETHELVNKISQSLDGDQSS